MKLTHARIATNDVPALVRFYETVTGISPVGNEDYVEFCSPVGTLAICSQRTVDLYNAGATTPAANRSAIVEFQVDDVDRERTRLHRNGLQLCPGANDPAMGQPFHVVP